MQSEAPSCDLRLLGVGHIHDGATFEHVGEAGLELETRFSHFVTSHEPEFECLHRAIYAINEI